MTDNKKDIHPVFQVLNFVFGSQSDHFPLLPFHRLLLIALARHKGVKGIYPSMSTLAKELKVTSRYIKMGIIHLESIKLINVERKYGKSNHYFLSFLSVTGEPQFTSELQITGEPQFTIPVNPSSPHRGTTVHPINTEEELKRNNRERGRKKRAPLSPDFSPSEKTRAIIDESGYSEDEIEIIFEDFMDHYLDSDTVSNAWNKKLIKWFNNEKREPGFLGSHKTNGNGHAKNGSNGSFKIDTVADTYVRTEESVRTAKEALANILGNLKGVKPNGLLGTYTGNDRVDKEGT